MKVEDAIPRLPDAVRDGGLFDIHVEGVQQQAKVGRAYVLKQCQALRGGVDKGRFVTVDRFQGQPHA